MNDSTMRHQVSALRAVAHPVRLRILSLLTGAEMSAAELARELGITHANASYHLRVLASAGEVVESGEEKIRGGVAKRFRHPWGRAEKSGSEAPDDGPLFVRAVADELVRRFGHRVRGGTNIVSDAEMWVEPEVLAEVTSLVAQASNLIHSRANPPRTEGTAHVNLTAALFEMGDDQGDAQGDAQGKRGP